MLVPKSPEAELRRAFVRAGSQCECRISDCHGNGPQCSGRCRETMLWEDYGKTWRVVTAEGNTEPGEDSSDYFVLCSDPVAGTGCFEYWTGRADQPRAPGVADSV